MLDRLSNINELTGDDEAFDRLASDYEDEEEEEVAEDPELTTGPPQGSVGALDQAEDYEDELEHLDDHTILALDAGTATPIWSILACTILDFVNRMGGATRMAGGAISAAALKSMAATGYSAVAESCLGQYATVESDPNSYEGESRPTEAILAAADSPINLFFFFLPMERT